ncbi:MAG: TatD family hydrolase [Bacteroides sp.]|nr:TatD family hydrolase [Bacteroides sp.]
MPPVDIHTHLKPLLPGTAIESCRPEEFFPQAGGYYSVGLHPWFLPDVSDDASAGEPQTFPEHILREQLERVARCAAHPQVLAIGEAGLDKLARAPFSLQLELFRRQALLAETLQKPLIIHLVRATAELLHLRRLLAPAMPWIVHGFRGKATLARELLHHGLFLSFGEKYQETALQATPADRLFLETDESPCSVEALYSHAAQVRGIPPQELRQTVEANIQRCFFCHK